MREEWVLDIKEQCELHGVLFFFFFFFKQWGGATLRERVVGSK
jgi:protein gp37